LEAATGFEPVAGQSIMGAGKFMEPKSKASRRMMDLAPELVHQVKKWKLACPKGELELIFPTEEGTHENSANLLYR